MTVEHAALVGLMGAGKSTVARAVAAELGWHAVDVDAVILDRTGMTVKELWERGGEAGYRPLEASITSEALGPPGSVVAVPGGAILDPTVQAELRRPEVLVTWLDVPVEELAERTDPDDDRPLLGDDPVGVLRRQLDEREALLRDLAHLVLDGTRPPAELADELAATIRAAADGQPIG